jgi:UDP-N-acetylglucosamine--N-acetylmuramyl-(pentapeptide) pyrophosphoryl-undecaprenol N-acetylglucosamine transferase
VVFTKGGYVCLPVGLAAKILRIKLVIHDSDAHPGLTNRVLGKFADFIGTGAPLKYYNYSKTKSAYVGIPVSDEYRVFSSSEKKSARERWGLSANFPLTVVTGGGLGASRINDAIIEKLDDLLKFTSVVLITGTGLYDDARSLTPPNSERFQLHAFVASDLASLLGASDVVVTRAGATTTLELAALKKPTIMVPNGKLTGGHQLKNAAVYLEKHAVRVVDDNLIVNRPELLVEAISELIDHPVQARDMAERFYEFSRPDAAQKMANAIIEMAK